MKNIFILPLLFIIGCESTEDIVKDGYRSLCERQPDSMSCIRHEDVGYVPSLYDMQETSYTLYKNFKYMTDEEQYDSSEYWFDGQLISNELIGDCEDISLTFISQLLIDGVKPSSIRLVASGIDGELKHYYVRVELDNGEYYNFYKIDKYTDIMYMQYDNIGVFVK